MKKTTLLPIHLLLLSASASGASLESVWSEIQRGSKAVEASRLELEAAEAGHSRASRHWLPRVYLNARGYQTNDPGASFFGLLSQRSVTAADFNPTSLNHPESRFFAGGALGIDLPLYEGGMRTAAKSFQTHQVAAKSSELAGTKNAQYLEVAKAYSALLTYSRQRKGLEHLSASVNRVLARYKIGVRSNPVGYSGLLGLKTLKNRIDASLAANTAGENAARLALREMGYRKEKWEPQTLGATAFAAKYLDAAKGESTSLSALRGQALSAKEGAKMEGARYLPRVGLFAEESLFHGKRSTETGWAAGLYLQWNLFNPNESGLAHEARLRAAAAESGSIALEERERAEVAGLEQALEATRAGLKLSETSEALLEEQTQVAESLFRTGSIPALQLVEALSRRLDLILAHAEAEQALVRLSADRAARSGFRAPEPKENL